MKIVTPGFEYVEPIDGFGMLKKIEGIARVCYKSEECIKDDSCFAFVRMLIENGHEAMLEHAGFSVKLICDRGVSHELVRHRMASFAQESTRYCNYSKGRFRGEIAVVKPNFLDEKSALYGEWEAACRYAEKAYFAMLDNGATAQEARSVLPNSLKTEVVMTANLREWRHILRLRCSSHAHPQMKELMVPLLNDVRQRIPICFVDIQEDW